MRTVRVRLADDTMCDIGYDEVVVTAGAVTRVFPVPGVAEHAIGMKHIEEAVAIRDAILKPPRTERAHADGRRRTGECHAWAVDPVDTLDLLRQNADPVTKAISRGSDTYAAAARASSRAR